MAAMKGPLGWLIATLVLCGVVALAYLPPRGISRESKVTLSGTVTGPPTAERQRANELAKEWRRAALDVRLHEWRERLAPNLVRSRSANQPTLVAMIDTGWPPDVRELAARLIDEAWESLELGTTKVGIAVVIEPEPVAAGATARGGYGYAYLLPDSTERHTCVAWSAARPAMSTSLEKNEERSATWHAQWARMLLGPCAFYARFGRPSADVERWLAQREHRYAQLPAWDSTWTVLLQRERRRLEVLPPSAVWRKFVLRTYPPLVLGCMAGKATACNAAALGPAPGYGTVPRLVTGAAGREPELPGSMSLLSDMVRDLGGARFARFWISDLAPDSAFHVAMDTTLGEWVLARQRAFGPSLDTGPTPTLGAGAFGLGIAAFALALAAVAATRRQVS